MTFLRRAPFIRRRSTGTGIVNPLGVLTLYDDTIGTAAIGEADFFTDGTITYVGSTSSGPTNWYTPITTNIGSSYWIKVTVTSGSDMAPASTIANNTLTQLSTDKFVRWTQLPGSSGGTKVATADVKIYSDSGGSNLVSSGTIDVDVTASVA